MITIPREPQTIGQVLCTGTKIWKNFFLQLLPFAAIFAITEFSYRRILVMMVPQVFQTGPFAKNLEITANQFWMMLAMLLVYWTLICISHAGMVISIYAQTQNQPLDFNHALFISFKKAFPVLITIFLCWLAVFLGVVLLIIPGIIIAVALWFSSYIVVFSEKGIGGSMGESMDLVAKNWWHSAGVLASFMIPLTSISLGQQLLFKGSLVGDALIAIMAFFTLPFVYCVSMSLYYDLQVRKKQKVEPLPSVQA